ncbi:MAG TPA: hypothetical protein VM940_17270 [Chthoniobacterales bacterium]|nr:hypothetical protein [Chthoniobacterales bacterium]
MQTTPNQPRNVACRLLCVTALLLLGVVPQAISQSGGAYDLTWNTIDGGGTTSATGGNYSLGGTIGQPDAGASSGGAYSLTSGFWGVANVIPARLANISTRLRVETGDNALFAGFIVTGTQPKRLIVRAIGPSLGLPDKLENPTLEIYQGNTLLEANDNWVDSPNKQAIIDSTVPPGNDFESAVTGLAPANGASYTAIVRGASGGTGVGLVEVYDLDGTVDSKLANISTRGLVQTGNNVLIAGTIILGSGTQKVLIRAIGPSLPVAGRLENPTLELRDQNGGLLKTNDDWRSSQEAEIIATTIPPGNDLESAIVATLPANNASYTAIVRGVNDITGIAVVEVYALP